MRSARCARGLCAVCGAPAFLRVMSVACVCVAGVKGKMCVCQRVWPGVSPCSEWEVKARAAGGKGVH